MSNLAGRNGVGSTVREIAAETKVPAGYLSKVMRSLRTAGLVRSRRGLKGGVSLSRPPAEISALQIIQAVDQSSRVDTCPLGRTEHCEAMCSVHRKIDQAVSIIEQTFLKITLSELADTAGVCPARDGRVSLEPPC